MIKLNTVGDVLLYRRQLTASGYKTIENTQTNLVVQREQETILYWRIIAETANR